MSSFVKFEENVGIKLVWAVWHGEKKTEEFSSLKLKNWSILVVERTRT